MAKTIEEIMIASIEKGVEQALTKQIRPLIKENQLLKKEIAELKTSLEEMIEKLAVKNNFDSLDDERLITKVQAGSILGINKKSIDGLIDKGIILTVDVPDGRDKVLKSSVTKYIQSLQVKNLPKNLKACV